MTKKISFRLFLTVIGRGIKQGLLWIAGLFGYKGDGRFDKVVWRIFALSMTIIALFFAGACICALWNLAEEKYSEWKRNQPDFCHSYDNEYLSRNVLYHDEYDDKSYVYNNAKQRRTLTGITWICKSQDGDSLVCFSDGKKRGYFNGNTGEVVIPAQYDHAWIFSDGVAGVVMDNELSFIGHDGQTIFERPVYYNAQASMDYCFYEGLCAVMADEQHVGLINKKGEWVVEPTYTGLYHSHKHFWVAKRDDNTYGMFNREGRLFLPFEYADITISDESEYIHVRTFAHMDQILDLNGHLQNPCDYYGINKLTYSTDELDSVGDFRIAVANCLQYNTSDGHYGLMDKLGNAITPPLYISINAIAANRYQCEAVYGSVIVDDAGKECGVKPQ